MVTGVTDITGEVGAESRLTARDCASLLDMEEPGVASMVEMSLVERNGINSSSDLFRNSYNWDTVTKYLNNKTV